MLYNFMTEPEKTVEEVENTSQWIDDFTLNADSEDELLSILQMFFEINAESKLRLNAKKASFYSEMEQFYSLNIFLTITRET